jgi:hypothetical protein
MPSESEGLTREILEWPLVREVSVERLLYCDEVRVRINDAVFRVSADRRPHEIVHDLWQKWRETSEVVRYFEHLEIEPNPITL